MSQSPEQSEHYVHAKYRHEQFTELMKGMGVFDLNARFDDEFTLRERVALFYKTYSDEERALRYAQLDVPELPWGYGEACSEGKLAARVAPKLASKSLVYTGIHGDFDAFSGIYEAYLSSMLSIPAQRSAEAKLLLRDSLRRDTVSPSDRLSVLPDDDLLKVNYGQTLRRLLNRNAMTEELYMARVAEAGMRPVSRLARKLRSRQ